MSLPCQHKFVRCGIFKKILNISWWLYIYIYIYIYIKTVEKFRELNGKKRKEKRNKTDLAQ